ncbi:TraA protein, partial [Dietzia kunjamensis]|nr:TraA protein [Dietzia kunjamensis]
FTAATLPAYIDALPRAYAHQLEADPDQYQALEGAWTEAATRGLDPREVWDNATDTLGTADKPGSVIAHRIRHTTRETTDAAALPTPPPATPGCDTELTIWLAETHRALTAGPAAQAVARAASFTAEDFVASYLESRSAEHEPGPDTHPTTSSPWGPSTDSSPDLW